MPKPLKFALLESYRGCAHSILSLTHSAHMNLSAGESKGVSIHARELHGEIHEANALDYASVAAWVSALFDHPNCMQISNWPMFLRAQSLAECDAVLVCFSDIDSLKALIERIHYKAPNAAIFTVSTKLTPSQQAVALNLGADDVLDIGMASCEGAARVRAVCRRIAQTRAAR